MHGDTRRKSATADVVTHRRARDETREPTTGESRRRVNLHVEAESLEAMAALDAAMVERTSASAAAPAALLPAQYRFAFACSATGADPGE